MNQDQRIGLALGVLLLGAAGAFFFRVDTSRETGPRRLKTASELDSRIAEKAVTPYLQRQEDVEDSKRMSWSRKSTESHLNQSSDLFDSSFPSDFPPIPLPDSNHIATDHIRKNGSDHVKPTAATEIHIVQSHETLMTIAAKRLGNANRFIELYEANRDQLKDPNSLTIGLELRIPNQNPEDKGNLRLKKLKKNDRLGDAALPLLDPFDASPEFGEQSPGTQDPHRPIPRNSSAEVLPWDSGKKNIPVPLPSDFLRTPLTNQTPNSNPNVGRRLSTRPPESIGGRVSH